MFADLSEADALSVWSPAFEKVAAEAGLRISNPAVGEIEADKARAAQFVLALLRERAWLRLRFPCALSEGPDGRFSRWVCGAGKRRYRVSDKGAKKIRTVFRRHPGKRVYDIYLNDPELQRYYPFALLPCGQRHFLGWLTQFGRADQKLSDEEILWFLQESAEDWSRGLALTYLLQPKLQARFPEALTRKGWSAFRRAFVKEHPTCSGKLLRRLPSEFAERSVAGAPAGKAGNASSIPGVNVISHFCNPSGIQQAALWTKAALERAGLTTSCRDVPVPRVQVPQDRADWLGLEWHPITILTHAATPYFESAYERSGLFRRPDVFRIAYWAWELERVPDDWVNASATVDEIWSPTEFVAQAMRTRMSRPVHKMLPGVEIGPVDKVSRAGFGVGEDRYVFLFMFDLHSQIHRKNPRAVIRAFESAFGHDDKVELIIKSSGGEVHAGDLAELRNVTRDQRVHIVDAMLSRSEAYGLIEMCDCYVSLHRSEGFGLGMAEAMLLGKPVIATAYSGNLDFMTADNSFLVQYTMLEITEERPLYTKGNLWADPSIEHAAALMRHVYDHPDEAAAKAQRAQPEIRDLLSLQKAGERMLARLNQIKGQLGAAKP